MDSTNGDVVVNATKISDIDSPNNQQSMHDDDGDQSVTISLSIPTTNILPLSELIDPPPSRSEILRDKWLDFLSGRVHFWIGVTVMTLIIIDGALFFFLAIGAHDMCTPRFNCNPRNWWYNFSIQFLNVLFTYLATISLPWRLSNAAHLYNSSSSMRKYNRSNEVGLDLYGQPTEKIWYHIPQWKRRSIVFFLILNSLTQYANQATRFIFYSFELQNVFPGHLWTNIFFVMSMVCAALGGFMQLHAELKLRKVHPDKFPPALFETLGEYLAKVCDIRRKRRTRADGGDHQEAKFHSDDIDIEENRRSLERGESKLVRNIHNFFSNDGPRSLGVVKWIHYVHKIGVRTTDRDRDQLSLEELS